MRFLFSKENGKENEKEGIIIIKKKKKGTSRLKERMFTWIVEFIEKKKKIVLWTRELHSEVSCYCHRLLYLAHQSIVSNKRSRLIN